MHGLRRLFLFEDEGKANKMSKGKNGKTSHRRSEGEREASWPVLS